MILTAFLSTLTAERLREVLHYDPQSGKFIWKVRLSARRSVGDVAGFTTRDGKYTSIRIDGKLYLAHRLAWLYVTGVWPAEQIDHKNGYSDGIANIRAANNSQNHGNARKRRDNTSGFKGVTKRSNLRKPWRARVNHNGVEKCIAHFSSAAEAAGSYDAELVRSFGEFALTNKMLGLLP